MGTDVRVGQEVMVAFLITQSNMLPGSGTLFGVLKAFQCNVLLTFMACVTEDIQPESHRDLVTIPTKHGILRANVGPPLQAILRMFKHRLLVFQLTMRWNPAIQKADDRCQEIKAAT